jgi:hypothetical protein
MLFDSEVYQVRAVNNNRVSVRDLRDVAALNKLQLHAATSCVYFGDMRFADYVKALWDDERGRLTAHPGKVIEATEVDADTMEPVGELVHGFQPQLNYRPLFTFLKHGFIQNGHARRTLRRAGAASLKDGI